MNLLIAETYLQINWFITCKKNFKIINTNKKSYKYKFKQGWENLEINFACNRAEVRSQCMYVEIESC